MPQDNMPIAERGGEPRLGGTENRDYGHAKQSGKVHRARIVGQERVTGA